MKANTNLKIKIFIDAHCFDKEHQGTRSYIKRLYVELSKIAPNIEFYFGAQDISGLAIELKEVQNCKFVKYNSSGTLSRLLFEIPLIIWKNKIDFAHFQYISPFIKNCKQIVTTHDVLFNDFKSEFSLVYRITRTILFKRSIQNADVKTTVSEYSKRSINKHFNINLNEICVTPNSISPDFFISYDKNISKAHIKNKFKVENYLLYVSRFEPRKNHVQLLKTYLNLKLYEKKYYLVLVGHMSIKTPEFEILLDSVDKKIRNFILINYSVNDDDLFHFYRGANVFVYPSKAEGFGLPPVEAAALKIPVICSNTTAMSDFSFFGEYHINPNNHELFSEKLNKIITSPPNEMDLTQISNLIAEKYSYKQTAIKFYEAVFKNV